MRAVITVLLGVLVTVGLFAGVYYFTKANMVDITFISDPTDANVVVTFGVARYTGRTPVTFEIQQGQEGRYTVTAQEPYEYRLYKTYSGTLSSDEPKTINVWLDRTSAEEQEVEQAAIAERKAQEERERQERAEAARIEREERAERDRIAAEQREAERQRQIEAQYVYYRMETNCPQGASITFNNKDGDTTQHARQGSGWYYGFIPRNGTFMYISAQNQCSSGYVTVRLTQDGLTIRENTSTGGYVIASISGRW